MKQPCTEFQEQVIAPILSTLGLRHPTLTPLLTGAALANGFSPWRAEPPALGLFAMTPQWHQHIWDTYLAFRPDLASDVRGFASQHFFLREPHRELANNQAYATAIATAALLRVRELWPASNNPIEMAYCCAEALQQPHNAFGALQAAFETLTRQTNEFVAA